MIRLGVSLTQVAEAAAPLPVGRQRARVVDVRRLLPVLQVLAQEQVVALGLQGVGDTTIDLAEAQQKTEELRSVDL